MELAIRYTDYNTLVKICYSYEYPKNMIELNLLMNKYSQKQQNPLNPAAIGLEGGESFNLFVFKYLQDSGKMHLLLSDDIDPSHKDSLFQFLKTSPRYSWINSIRFNDFHGATDAIYFEAMNEKDSIQRRKNLLSLHKLSVLASEPSGELTLVHQIKNAQNQFLVDYQLSHFPSDTIPKDPAAFISKIFASPIFSNFSLHVRTPFSFSRPSFLPSSLSSSPSFLPSSLSPSLFPFFFSFLSVLLVPPSFFPLLSSSLSFFLLFLCFVPLPSPFVPILLLSFAMLGLPFFLVNEEFNAQRTKKNLAFPPSTSFRLFVF